VAESTRIRHASRIAAVAVLAFVLGACSSEPPLPTHRPSPSPVEPPNPALVELSTRIQQAIGEHRGMVGLLADASVGNVALQPVANSMKLWAEDQARWLDEHPPEPCFADAHGLLVEAVANVAASGETLLELAAASPPPAEQEFQAPMNQLNDASAGFTAAQAAARADLQDCRGE